MDGKRSTRRRANLTRSPPSPLLFSRPRNALAANSLQEPVRSCFSGVGKALYGPRSRDQLQPSQGTKRTQFPSRRGNLPGRSTPGTKRTQFPSRPAGPLPGARPRNQTNPIPLPARQPYRPLDPAVRNEPNLPPGAQGCQAAQPTVQSKPNSPPGAAGFRAAQPAEPNEANFPVIHWSEIQFRSVREPAVRSVRSRAGALYYPLRCLTALMVNWVKQPNPLAISPTPPRPPQPPRSRYHRLTPPFLLEAKMPPKKFPGRTGLPNGNHRRELDRELPRQHARLRAGAYPRPGRDPAARRGRRAAHSGADEGAETDLPGQEPHGGRRGNLPGRQRRGSRARRSTAWCAAVSSSVPPARPTAAPANSRSPPPDSACWPHSRRSEAAGWPRFSTGSPRRHSTAPRNCSINSRPASWPPAPTPPRSASSAGSTSKSAACSTKPPATVATTASGNPGRPLVCPTEDKPNDAVSEDHEVPAGS